MPLTAQFVRNLQRFRLVTFDVTDTLIRLKDPVAQYAQTAAACGVAGVDKSQLELCFRQQFKLMSKEHSNFGSCSPNMGWESWWQQLVSNTFTCVAGSRIPPATLQAISEQLLFEFRTSACWSHVECAAELVERVRAAGKCVGVISNFDPSLTQVLDAMGFGDKFDFILTSYAAGVMKPDAGIFQMALKPLNIAPSEALHIGNKVDMDYLGARNSGWSSLLVQPQSDAHLDIGPAAKHTYPSLAEMLEALETRQIVW